MTRRILLILLCLSLLLLTGCTEGSLSDLATELKEAGASFMAREPIVPRLRPLDWTPENLALLDALGENELHDHHLSDFIAPEGTQKLIVTQWALRDGQWHTPGSRTLLLEDAKGQLGLCWDNLCGPVNIVLRTSTHAIAVSHIIQDWERPTGSQTFVVYQIMDIPILLEEEIPLVMQIVTDAQDPVIALESWQETERLAGHIDVRLVTVRFSGKPMEVSVTPQP